MASTTRHLNIGDLQGSFRDHNLPSNQVVTPYTCLVVKTGKHKVLINTGADGLAPTLVTC